MSANKITTGLNHTTSTTNIDELHSISKNLNDIKLWIIIIAIIIIKVIVMKVIKLCKNAYSKHNERIIERANRISPRI